MNFIEIMNFIKTVNFIKIMNLIEIMNLIKMINFIKIMNFIEIINFFRNYEFYKNYAFFRNYELIRDFPSTETLRKYPPVTILMRKSLESHTFETPSKDTTLTVQKGQKVWIPIYGIQRDARYFPEPEVFNPERFTEEAIKARHPMSYLPFGDGPRNCIGTYDFFFLQK